MYIKKKIGIYFIVKNKFSFQLKFIKIYFMFSPNFARDRYPYAIILLLVPSLSVFYILCKNTSREIYAFLFENNILSGRSKKSLLILQEKKKKKRFKIRQVYYDKVVHVFLHCFLSDQLHVHGTRLCGLI